MVVSRSFVVSQTMGIYAIVFISLCYLPAQLYLSLQELKDNWHSFKISIARPPS